MFWSQFWISLKDCLSIILPYACFLNKKILHLKCKTYLLLQWMNITTSSTNLIILKPISCMIFIRKLSMFYSMHFHWSNVFHFFIRYNHLIQASVSLAVLRLWRHVVQWPCCENTNMRKIQIYWGFQRPSKPCICFNVSWMILISKQYGGDTIAISFQLQQAGFGRFERHVFGKLHRPIYNLLILAYIKANIAI